jgi:hypothetical protein
MNDLLTVSVGSTGILYILSFAQADGRRERHGKSEFCCGVSPSPSEGTKTFVPKGSFAQHRWNSETPRATVFFESSFPVIFASVSPVPPFTEPLPGELSKGKGEMMKRMRRDGFWIKNWEKLTAFGFGIIFIAVLLVIAFMIPTPTVTQWFVFRVVLALAAAGFGAIVPGLIVINVSNVVRAGGAIALFVLVYWFNPPKLVVSDIPGMSIQQTTGGQNSPAVVAGGDVTITNDAKGQKGEKKK